MADKDINKIVEEMTNKDSKELIKIVFIEPGNYIKEISDSAKKELVKRGINKDSDIVKLYLKELELKESKKIVWFDEAWGEGASGILSISAEMGRIFGASFLPVQILLSLIFVFGFVLLGYQLAIVQGFDRPIEWLFLVFPLIGVLGSLSVIRRAYRLMTGKIRIGKYYKGELPPEKES